MSETAEVTRLTFKTNSPDQAERLTLTGCCGHLDRVQHAMTRDRVVECRAQMRSRSIIEGEKRVRLGDVGGRALRRRQIRVGWWTAL